MKNFMTAAFATAAIALLTASPPVVADEADDQDAAQKPTLMSDAEMDAEQKPTLMTDAEMDAVVAGVDFTTINVPGGAGSSPVAAGVAVYLSVVAAEKIINSRQ